MDLFIDSLLTDVLDLLGSDTHERCRAWGNVAIVFVRGVSSGMRNAQNHIVGRSESMDLFIDSSFADVLGLHEGSRVLVLEAIILVGRVTSSMRDGQDHVVGRGEFLYFFVKRHNYSQWC